MTGSVGKTEDLPLVIIGSLFFFLLKKKNKVVLFGWNLDVEARPGKKGSSRCDFQGNQGRGDACMDLCIQIYIEYLTKKNTSRKVHVQNL